MFSILIPTFNNLEYLKLCIQSQNSHFNNQIICHVNIGEDGTVDFFKKKQYWYSYTAYNSVVKALTSFKQSMIIICTHMMTFIFAQIGITFYLQK